MYSMWNSVERRPSWDLMSQIDSPEPFLRPNSHRSCRKPSGLSPLISSIRVDLPLPLPPTTTHFSPRRTRQLSRSKTVVAL
eukprot:4500475-Prymnesium_polylepis.1